MSDNMETPRHILSPFRSISETHHEKVHAKVYRQCHLPAREIHIRWPRPQYLPFEKIGLCWVRQMEQPDDFSELTLNRG